MSGDCVHHWVLAALSGTYPYEPVPARCKHCGAEREFDPHRRERERARAWAFSPPNPGAAA